jgi:hypothetical protein
VTRAELTHNSAGIVLPQRPNYAAPVYGLPPAQTKQAGHFGSSIFHCPPRHLQLFRGAMKMSHAKL